MIYQKHTKAQEWGMKQNDKTETEVKPKNYQEANLLNFDDIQDTNKFIVRTKTDDRQPSELCTKPTLAAFTAGGFATGAGKYCAWCGNYYWRINRWRCGHWHRLIYRL